MEPRTSRKTSEVSRKMCINLKLKSANALVLMGIHYKQRIRFRIVFFLSDSRRIEKMAVGRDDRARNRVRPSR